MLRQFKRVERTSPTLGAKPPAGSVVLFDGTKETLEEHWKNGAKMTEDGLLTEGCTSVDTFGDYAMHLVGSTSVRLSTSGVKNAAPTGTLGTQSPLQSRA